jgi:hypothetical protein
MYFFNNKLAFKKRPEGIIPGEGLKSKTSPSSNFGINDNAGEIPNQVYKFNIAGGFPESIKAGVDQVSNALAGKSMKYTDHALDQAQRKNIPLQSTPHLNDSFPGTQHGFSPVEVEVAKTPSGQSRIHKMVMRGPLDDKDDVVIPTIIRPSGPPLATTVWRNNRTDNHNTVDMRRYHLPVEFAHGTAPTRRLVTDEEARMPGYQPLLSNNEAARSAILAKHGRIK